MGVFSSDRPYTAVTSKIDQLVSMHDGFEPEAELPSLLESIKLQSTGATEAARAIRKKLKYGTPQEQLKALVILELIVSNGGRPLNAFYSDSKLLENLRVIANDKSRNPKVKNKIIVLSHAWRRELNGLPGYEQLANLHSQVPGKVKKEKRQRDTQDFRAVSNNMDFMEDTADESTPFDDLLESDSSSASTSRTHSRTPSSSDTKKHRRTFSRSKTNEQIDREYKIPKIDYVKAKPKILQLLAESSTASTDLINSLHSLRKGELSLDNDRASLNFEKCRRVRRKVLRFLQLIDHEDYLGSLIHANEELVKALLKFETLSKPNGGESESEYETDEEFEADDESVQLSSYTYESSGDDQSIVSGFQKTHISDFPSSKRAPPPIPSKPKGLIFTTSNKAVEIHDDEDDPFGDDNKTDMYTASWA